MEVSYEVLTYQEMISFHPKMQQKLIATLFNNNFEKCILFPVESYQSNLFERKNHKNFINDNGQWAQKAAIL